ncbi:hypothetical protein AVEN_260107-1, partial [Araneus ventricosus]
MIISGGSDKLLKFWKFKDRGEIATMELDQSVSKMILQRERLVDWFTVTPLCVRLTVSPSGEYLATVYVGSRGICCPNVLLYQLPEAYNPLQLYLPMITMDGRYENNEVAGEAEADDPVPKFKSPEQISDELVTLSLVSNSHWLNLLDLDIIK